MSVPLLLITLAAAAALLKLGALYVMTSVLSITAIALGALAVVLVAGIVVLIRRR